MKQNVDRNRLAIESSECEGIHCIELDWFAPPDVNALLSSISSTSSPSIQSQHFPQVILIADCVWLEELVNPLMDTVEKYCCDARTEVIITYQRRGKAAHVLFWKRMRDIFRFIEQVDTFQACGQNKPESISLLICHR
jgi:hypothetical protein